MRPLRNVKDADPIVDGDAGFESLDVDVLEGRAGRGRDKDAARMGRTRSTQAPHCE